MTIITHASHTIVMTLGHCPKVRVKLLEMPNAPFVLISGYDEIPAEVLTRVQVFVEKPFATEQFLPSVETAIAAKSEPILSGIPEVRRKTVLCEDKSRHTGKRLIKHGACLRSAGRIGQRSASGQAKPDCSKPHAGPLRRDVARLLLDDQRTHRWAHIDHKNCLRVWYSGEKTTHMKACEQFADDLWVVEGPNVRDFGIVFTTRMVIARLSDGSLWVDSPVPASSDTLRRVTALGPVRYLVSATPRHVWRLADWHRQFPEAELWAAKPSPFTLKKGDLEFTGILTETTPRAWAEDLDQVPFWGNPLIEEVIFFHKTSRTVILDDLIQNHLPVKGKPLRNTLFKLAGVLYPNGGVPLDARLSFIHRAVARRSLRKLLSWDFDKLIIAHGVCIETNAKAFIERAFQWLM